MEEIINLYILIWHFGSRGDLVYLFYQMILHGWKPLNCLCLLKSTLQWFVAKGYIFISVYMILNNKG